MPITNWTEFFREEHDIYVQNIANAQVSIDFEMAPGMIQGFLFPHSRHPVNLTQHIPFNAIKSSTSLRKMLNRRPPALQLLSETEFNAYYQSKAAEWKLPDPVAAVSRAEEIRLGIADHTAFATNEKPTPIHQVVEDGKQMGERKTVRAFDSVSSDEIIHPRVLHVCNQVNPEIPDAQKMSAGAMLEEFDKVSHELKLDDYEYIRGHGWWKTVKTWAKGQAAAMASTSEEGDG